MTKLEEQIKEFLVQMEQGILDKPEKYLKDIFRIEIEFAFLEGVTSADVNKMLEHLDKYLQTKFSDYASN